MGVMELVNAAICQRLCCARPGADEAYGGTRHRSVDREQCGPGAGASALQTRHHLWTCRLGNTDDSEACPDTPPCHPKACPDTTASTHLRLSKH
eukprot:1409176-Rhodomonas_salina.4